MSGPYAQQWAHIIQEELDPLEKNKMWVFIEESEVE